MKQIQEWRWENDEEALRKKLFAPSSYPEYVTTVIRLRELTGKGDQKIEFSPQELDEELHKDLMENPAQLRALFVEDSPFKDHILYSEYKPVWQPEQIYSRVKWSKKAPEGFDKDVYKTFVEIPLGFQDELKNEAIQHNFAKALKKLEKPVSQLSEQEIEKLKKSILAITKQAKNWKQDKKNSTFCTFAEVEPYAEKELVEKLLSQGAFVDDNRLQINDYHASGKRFALHLDSGSALYYVPYKSIGTKEVEKFQHTMTWPGASVIADVKKRIIESFESHVVWPKDVFVCIDHYDSKFLQPRVLLKQKNRLGPKRREEMQEAAEKGTLLRLGEGKKFARHTQILFADQARLESFPDYYTKLKDGSFMYHRAQKARERLLQVADKLADADIRLSWESDYEDPPQKGVGESAEIVWKAFRGTLQKFDFKQSEETNKDFFNILSISGVESLFVHDCKIKSVRQEVKHDAPRSERGVLRLDNMPPKMALETMQKLGLFAKICPLIPYDIIYRGRHKLGRVLPWHPEYALQQKNLALPKGNVIVHGLTGISGEKGALSRLEQIIKTGGLKSIAERRRMGLHIKGTMSPEGDTGSGTDIGVPTRITTNHCVGAMIFFVLKPTAILRRDLFFAPHDYGGSHTRYESYTNYAKQIGQGKIYHVAPHNARKKHLKTGLGGSNELYLRHEIPWDEVDVLMVYSTLKDDVENMLQKYADKLSSIPRVETYSQGVAPTIAKIHKEQTYESICV